MDNIDRGCGRRTEVRAGDARDADRRRGRRARAAEELARRLGHDQLRDHLRHLAARAARARAAPSERSRRRAARERSRRRCARRARRSRDGAGLAGRRHGARRAARSARSTDVDLVVAGDAGGGRARDWRGRGERHVFPLSERFGAWRVIARGPLLAGRRDADARRLDRGGPGAARLHRSTRWPCRSSGGELIDPHGGPRGPRRAASCARSASARSRRPAAHAADGALRVRARLRGRAGDARARRAPRPRAASRRGRRERSFYELRRLVAGRRPAARHGADGRGRARAGCCRSSRRSRASSRTPTTTWTSGVTRSRCSSRCSSWSATRRRCSATLGGARSAASCRAPAGRRADARPGAAPRRAAARRRQAGDAGGQRRGAGAVLGPRRAWARR